jgi:hypothetical protein
MATVITIVHYNRTIITIVNYDPKTFIVQATDLVHAMPWQSMFTLSVYIMISM